MNAFGRSLRARVLQRTQVVHAVGRNPRGDSLRKICLIVAFLAGCIMVLYTGNYETSVLLRERVGSISHAGGRNEGLSTVNNTELTLPRYIFGHSTGHSGSTTSHATLRDARYCPWSLPSVHSFEKIFQFERSPPTTMIAP